MNVKPPLPISTVEDSRLPLPRPRDAQPSFLDSVRSRLRGLLLDVPIREAKRLEERITARTQIDMSGIVAGVRARLESHLPLHALPVAPDLAKGRGPWGWGSVETHVWEAPRLRKAALSSIRVLPMIEGLALVLLPSPELDYPVLACDFLALPARLSLNIELYGAPAMRPLCQQILRPMTATFAQLNNRDPLPWATVIGSGAGVHARVDPRRVEECSAAVSTTLQHYLAGLASAKPGALGVPSQRTFFAAFDANGPGSRKSPLARIFGAAWAARYSRLIFE